MTLRQQCLCTEFEHTYNFCYISLHFRLNGSMRSVVFVERLELDFEGNLFANAVMLGDVDNDGVSSS